MELPVSYLFTFTLFFLADLLESRLTTRSGSGLNPRLVMFGNQSEKIDTEILKILLFFLVSSANARVRYVSRR